jgi:hypothetical protein
LHRRLLFIVVIVLFSVMNLGAALGWVLDARDRRAFFVQLCAPDVGFRAEGKDGSCWLWHFGLEPLRGEMDAPTGTAVQLAALLGIPFARLRACMPDEARPQR